MIYQAVATPIQHDTAGRALKALWLGLLAALFVAVQAIQAYARPDSFADLADKVSPAVVNITTSTVVAQGAGPGPIVPEGRLGVTWMANAPSTPSSTPSSIMTRALTG